jgi:hypothetical protein
MVARRREASGQDPAELGDAEHPAREPEKGAVGILDREPLLAKETPLRLGRDPLHLAAREPPHHVVVVHAEEERE